DDDESRRTGDEREDPPSPLACLRRRLIQRLHRPPGVGRLGRLRRTGLLGETDRDAIGERGALLVEVLEGDAAGVVVGVQRLDALEELLSGGAVVVGDFAGPAVVALVLATLALGRGLLLLGPLALAFVVSGPARGHVGVTPCVNEQSTGPVNNTR